TTEKKKKGACRRGAPLTSPNTKKLILPPNSQLPSVQNPRLGDTALRVIATFAEDLKRGIPDGYH
ncbi:hypothetical protein, partial [Pseudomonas savastanoi]|uniref:hypothetical protein n=1 Tax=Pseudomonas savastanoi TaxID=29438 RepID=UPI00196740EC